ncbi:MAG TPA: GapR family DNA-binding domain-containing protein [Allosphingosinicella sp.]|nr:GapR family DNA-binding domain-containing protein [Allosphingosinicella sp.]
MADAPVHRHNGGPLNDDDARKLWNHIRALETLEEQKAEVAEDIKCRKEIVKADGFDTNIVAIILKRRKAGQGQTSAADNLLQLYEDALAEQKVLPLEETKRPKEGGRRTIEQIAEDLHGEPPPEDLVKQDEAPTIQ